MSTRILRRCCGSAALTVVVAGCAANAAGITPRVEEDTSMRRTLRDSVRAVLERALADSAFPGAYAVVGNARELWVSTGVGRLDWTPSPAPNEQTIWDLASLTKVIGTTTAMMQVVEAGLVDLDAPVQRYLPEWAGPGKERVTVRHLLTHSAGLPAWRPLYKEATTADDAMALVYATPLDTVPGARMVYSDLGAIIAGEVIRRVTRESLDGYLARRVFGPLGMTSTTYRPEVALRARIAPTEYDPWRQRHLRGEVHDENAFALGGVSAHAGLFSTARDLSRFARMLLAGGILDGVRIVAPETISRFATRQEPALSHRALGWETPSGANSAGTFMSNRAFGHTGFTGTSIWIDPDHGVFVLLLSNRVNPTRENRRISGVRTALADAVMAPLARLRADPSTTRPPSQP